MVELYTIIIGDGADKTQHYLITIKMVSQHATIPMQLVQVLRIDRK